jgi:hypothetical protein
VVENISPVYEIKHSLKKNWYVWLRDTGTNVWLPGWKGTAVGKKLPR